MLIPINLVMTCEREKELIGVDTGDRPIYVPAPPEYHIEVTVLDTDSKSTSVRRFELRRAVESGPIDPDQFGSITITEGLSEDLRTHLCMVRREIDRLLNGAT